MMKSMLRLSFVGCLMISGCQSHNANVPKTSGIAPAMQTMSVPQPSAQLAETKPANADVSENSASSQGAATLCQQQLAALAKINPAQYATQREAFDSLLKSVSTYSSVRNDVNAQTKDIMDTLYKFKTQKVCNDIQQAIQESLISRGETLQ